MEQLTRQSLLHKRKNKLLQTGRAYESRNADDALQESTPQSPILVIEICDHPYQEHVIRFRATKDEAELNDVRQSRSPYFSFGIDKNGSRLVG